MVSVTAHNRGLPAAAGGTPAAVLCPMCLLAGERVEMCHRDGGPSEAMESDGGGHLGHTVLCPRCGLVHFRREPA